MTLDNVLPQGRSLIRFLTVAIMMTSGVLGWLAWDAYALYRSSRLAEERNIKVEKLAGAITYMDEVLTMSARMGASTGALKWEERYRSYEPKLDAVIKEMMTLSPGLASSEAVKKTDAANIKLVELEHRAFDLVREGHLEEAKSAVMGNEYEIQKKKYAEGLSEFKTLFQSTNAQIRKKEYKRALLHIGFIASSVFVLMVGWGIILRVMKIWEKAVLERNKELTSRTNELARQANQLTEKTRELSELNASLDQRVSERTSELEFSRRAALNMNEDMIREIEERKRAEAALSESEQMNRDLFDQSPIGLALCSMDGKLVYVNPAYARIIGRTIGECLKLSYWDITPQKYEAQEKIQMESLKTTGRYGPYEKEYVHQDGHLVPVRLSGLVITKKDDLFIWSSVEDITDQKLMEGKLRAAHMRFQNIFSTAGDAIIVADKNQNIVLFNKQAEITFGFLSEEIVGKPLTTLIPARFRPLHSSHVAKFAAGPELQRAMGERRSDLAGLRKNGEEFPVEISISKAITDGQLFFTAVVRDLSELREREKALEKMNEELTKNEKMLTATISDLERAHTELKSAQGRLIEAEKSATVAQLAAGAAHEVKNPLAILLQGVEYLAHHADHNRNPNISSVLKDMADAVARADYTVKGLLDLARPEKLTVVSEDLNSIIENSFFLVKNYLEHRRVQTVKHFGEKLPRISADKGKIIQVFVNLLSNAADAMPKGGTITIKTYAKRLTKAGGQVGRRKEDVFSVGQQVAVAEITDTGEGISPEVLSKIFDPFFTTKRGKGGTGLGLSVVRNIVEIHRGTISIANKEGGGGACAIVMFPAEAGPSKE